MKKECYVCNGKFFQTYEEVISYCKGYNLRVTNTEKVKNTHIISVANIEPIVQYDLTNFPDKISGDFYRDK